MALTFQHKMDIISSNASEKVCEDKGTAVRVFHFGSSIIEGNISSLLLVRGTQTYQSGERMTGSHEVSGSIPLISTKKRKVCLWHTFLFYYIEPLSVQADRAERAYFNRKG